MLKLLEKTKTPILMGVRAQETLDVLSLLKDTEKDIDKRNDYIDIVNKSSSRLLNTVNDLIEISKIETNQITIQKSIVNVKEFMQEFYIFHNLS